jgi:hypothetical protein
MKARRSYPVLLVGAMLLAACAGPSKEELELMVSVRADSLTNLRNEFVEHVMEGTSFVNEINKELAKARGLTPPRQLQPVAELADANEERRQVVGRITQLVERLGALQGRVNGLRKQVADKDSAFALKVAEYEATVAEASRMAELQRAEFQALIDGQAAQIASLTRQVDTLNGSLSRVTSEHNTVYVIAGTRQELIKKGVLVPEGSRRFVVAGARPLVPARELDPTVFTRLDRVSDSTIVLPEGVYKIVSRQNGAYATPAVFKDGKVGGALKIEEPERFWSTSRYLILVRS